MLGRTMTCQLDGLSVGIVQVEAETLGGFSAFSIVGLAGPSIQESKERVRSAMRASGIALPPGKILVNLYPADERKSGTQWDLPITMALASAMGLVDPNRCERAAFVGELGLDGSLRPIAGIFQMVLGLVGRVDEIYLEESQARTCSTIEGIRIYPVKSLDDLLRYFRGEKEILPCPLRSLTRNPGEKDSLLDFKEIKGQDQLKKIMVLSVLGHHHLLFIGPPGNGKSMALERAGTIQPDLEGQALREVMGVRSIFTGREEEILSTRPPLLSPHYSITRAGLVGGGSPIQPGVITRAHRGILVLDELPLFSNECLDALRLPMDRKEISLLRNHRSRTYPSDFLLLSAMNPCPCGYYGSPDHDCACSPHKVKSYREKISQPLLDRFDMVVEVGPAEKTRKNSSGKDSKTMREEVEEGIDRIQFMKERGLWPLEVSREGQSFLDDISSYFHLSSRSKRKLISLARTIAIHRGGDKILDEDLAEAFQYRRARYKYWEK
ncbi:MAG: ATP-binding protein [Firmicutes bacterium]|nr:ATP-binding protein [Bacillota bacterium]